MLDEEVVDGGVEGHRRMNGERYKSVLVVDSCGGNF